MPHKIYLRFSNDEDLHRINTREDFQLSQKDQLSFIYNSQQYLFRHILSCLRHRLRRLAPEKYLAMAAVSPDHVLSPNFVTSSKAGGSGYIPNLYPQRR